MRRWAQSLTPLPEMPIANMEKTYAFVRCAAFYQATTEWVGSDRLGQSTFARIEENIKNLLAFAILIRKEGSSDSIEHTRTIALRDTRNIADLYLRRFETTRVRGKHGGMILFGHPIRNFAKLFPNMWPQKSASISEKRWTLRMGRRFFLVLTF